LLAQGAAELAIRREQGPHIAARLKLAEVPQGFCIVSRQARETGFFAHSTAVTYLAPV
jgi:hypothetical protein